MDMRGVDPEEVERIFQFLWGRDLRALALALAKFGNGVSLTWPEGVRDGV